MSDHIRALCDKGTIIMVHWPMTNVNIGFQPPFYLTQKENLEKERTWDIIKPKRSDELGRTSDTRVRSSLPKRLKSMLVIDVGDEFQ